MSDNDERVNAQLIHIVVSKDIGLQVCSIPKNLPFKHQGSLNSAKWQVIH
ncbi:hypothetical protein EfmAA96_28130 [Enterococcus faecium]|nr:hypothetical protein EfmAA96_28130 [Enterococcus faecium]